MKKKKLAAIIACNITLVIYIALLALHQYSSTHFSCEGEFSGANDPSAIKSKIYLNFYGQNGNSYLDGELTTVTGEKRKVRLYYQFSFTRKDNDYSIIRQRSSALAGNEVNETALRPLFPDYMTAQNKDGNIMLYRVSSRNFVITNSYLPIFYCRTPEHSHLFFS